MITPYSELLQRDGELRVAVQSEAAACLASTMHRDYAVARKMHASEDAREGSRAVAEKRRPN
jgi:hypothetical protein